MVKSQKPGWFVEKSQKPEWFEDESNDKDAEGEKTAKKSFCFCSAACVVLSVTELLLCALFVYSAIVQNNDADGIQWIVYYSLNAAIPALFMVYYTCCFPAKAIYFLSKITAIWSIVYIVIAALNVKNTPAGGDADGTGDNDNVTLRTEYIFELSGASIGLFSSLYHAVGVKCCAKKDKEKVEEDGIELNLSEQV